MPHVVIKLLNPILNLHGLEAYALVGALVFAEAAIMIGFVFPGETAAILGGVLASRGHVGVVALIVVVVLCAIVGDSVGYLVGQRWGRRMLDVRWLKQRRGVVDRLGEQLNRRGMLAVFLARFTAFLRAVVPGLAGMSSMSYRRFLVANAAGGIVWGTTFCLLGYLVGNAYTKVEHVSSIASDVLLALIVVGIVIVVVRHHRARRAQKA